MHVYLRPVSRFLACHTCGGTSFLRRALRLPVTGIGLLDPDRGARDAEVAVCDRCGYVHTFQGGGLQWLEPGEVKAEDLPADPLG